jgi:hypothetical protein
MVARISNHLEMKSLLPAPCSRTSFSPGVCILGPGAGHRASRAAHGKPALTPPRSPSRSPPPVPDGYYSLPARGYYSPPSPSACPASVLRAVRIGAPASPLGQVGLPDPARPRRRARRVLTAPPPLLIPAPCETHSPNTHAAPLSPATRRQSCNT